MLEFIDCLNEQGDLLGIKKKRDEVHRDGDWHRTVHIWLVNVHHQILLQKRSAAKESHPSLWDISCAGHVSAGETVIEAARKEIFEELGVTLLESELQWCFQNKMQSVQNKGAYIENELQEVFLWNIGDIEFSWVLQEKEVESVRWVDISEFKSQFKNWIYEGVLVDHAQEYERILDYI